MTQSGGNRRPQSQCSSVVFVHIVRLTRYVARRIQAASRRKAAKATVDAIRRQKQVEHNAAVSIQCFWRRKMAERALERRKAAQRLEKRRAAALEIQVRVAAAGASLRCTSPSNGCADKVERASCSQVAAQRAEEVEKGGTQSSPRSVR